MLRVPKWGLEKVRDGDADLRQQGPPPSASCQPRNLRALHRFDGRPQNPKACCFLWYSFRCTACSNVSTTPKRLALHDRSRILRRHPMQRRKARDGLSALCNRAANAAFCDRQSLSEQPTTMLIFPEFPPLCVILLSSTDAIPFSSSYRGSLPWLCAVWQRIFWSAVACGLFLR